MTCDTWWSNGLRRRPRPEIRGGVRRGASQAAFVCSRGLQGPNPVRRLFKAVNGSGQTVGYLELNRIDYDKRSALVSRVLVGKPEQRGQGLGYQMATALLDLAFREMGFDSLSLEVFDFNGGETWTSVRMRLDRHNYTAGAWTGGVPMHSVRKWRWLTLATVPILTYAGLIIAAYIKPPLMIPGLSTGYDQTPMAVVELENRGRWAVTIRSVSVQGVLPPDEVGAFLSAGKQGAQVYSPSHPLDIAREGELKGWVVTPQGSEGRNGVKLVWYQNADLRWLHCPTVRYRYLGWPMTARFVCDAAPRATAIRSGALPAELGDWGPWQSVSGGVRFRTQRLTQGRNDDLWIEVESERGTGLVLNRFIEEPAGGHARFRIRMVALEHQSATVHYSVPLRWGEPTPEIAMEVAQ
ncbi:MAG: GNAT family N-acetyltransferase [Actinomycetota bacterium]